jgi:heat shock protein HslJ
MIRAAPRKTSMRDQNRRRGRQSWRFQRRWPALFGPALASALFSGCETAAPRPAPPQAPPTPIVGAAWALVALGGEPPLPDAQLTLRLSDGGRAEGFAGVNDYFGPYQVQDAGRGAGPIAFGELGATRKAGPPPLMKQEQEYLERLRQADAFRAEGGLMELTAAGQPLLRFRLLHSAPAPRAGALTRRGSQGGGASASRRRE